MTEYAVTLGSIWSDEFEDLSGSDPSQSDFVEIVAANGERGIALTTGVLTGTVTSKPYALVRPGPGLVTVYFAGLADGPAATFQVDLLTESGAVIAAGVTNGDTVAVNTSAYPALRLRARFERMPEAGSPVLYRWRLNEDSRSRLYLPMVVD